MHINQSTGILGAVFQVGDQCLDKELDEEWEENQTPKEQSLPACVDTGPRTDLMDVHSFDPFFEPLQCVLHQVN